MKKILLILTIATSSFACAMQEPTSKTWQLNVTLKTSLFKKDLTPEQVIAELQEAYQDKLTAHLDTLISPDRKSVYFELDDTRESIIKRLQNKSWFSEKILCRPAYFSF